MQIIDGKALSVKIRAAVKTEAESFYSKHGRKPGLAVVLAGNDAASEIYVRNKIKGCEDTGIASFAYYFPDTVTEKELLTLVSALNEDGRVDGILVQLPLPKGIDEQKVLLSVSPDKDVDGFHPVNAGRLMLGEDCLSACTPSGCIELIKSTGVNISGLNAVVIGRSNIVGKPLALMLLKENATVTVCHSRTKDLKEIAAKADIVCAAIGRAGFVTADMVKPGAIVVDVGINRVDGKVCGDVDFAGVSAKASYITPVPGGVGPMTITMLLSNTVKAAVLANKSR